jgi:hypothetical protein
MDPDLSKIAERLHLAATESDLEAKLEDVASTCRFERLKVDFDSRFARATRRVQGGSSSMGSWHKDLFLHIEWTPSGQELDVEVTVYDGSVSGRKILDRGARDEVVEALRMFVKPKRPVVLTEIVLPPGESLRGPQRSPVRDYSRCAREKDLNDLFQGDLPLGRYYNFPRTAQEPRLGRPLFLSRFPQTGALMIYNGVLLCAPVNSGKTTLLLRWAAAANQAGYSTLLIDVKGNMREKLLRDYPQWRGERYCFSSRAGVDSDRINFLAPLARDRPLDPKQLEAMAKALLPSEGWEGEGGDAEMFYQGRMMRITAFLYILKFRHMYYPGYVAARKAETSRYDVYFRDNAPQDAPPTPSLAELYEFATNEELLCFWIKEIRQAEELHRRKGKGAALPEKGVDVWARDIAPIIHPDALPGYGERRDPKIGYRDCTYGVALALQPFSEGVLKKRTSPTGPGRLFDFHLLNRHRDDPPVTLLLEVGEDDPKQSTALISLTMRALEPALHARLHTTPRPGSTVADWQPLLLLLDETRRIRGFDPVNYITFARERQAGCVLVYQAINLIGSPEVVDTVLSNVGTQVYLGGLTGRTATAFVQSLPKEERKVSVTNESDGTAQSHWERLPILTEAEMHNLPPGPWSALVMIRHLRAGKPFLVDLDQAADRR